MPQGLIWLIWLLPLAASAIIALMQLLPGRPRASYIALAATLGSFGLSLWALLSLLYGGTHQLATPAFNWLSIGGLELSFSLVIDPLTAVMLMVVTIVTAMVQMYSRGYMHTDLGYRRYYAAISLFAFAMLGLVLSDSLLLMFICWELVGLCSYLLIGFWFHRPAAAAAAKKAFLVTRVGDVGFLAAILVLYANAGTLNIAELHSLALAGAIGATALTWATIGLFLGAMGKSAQFPLHIWLPDAMEGPPPGSALIHAPTLGAAGVYLVARMYPLFESAPGVLTGIAIIGAFTALFAATMGLVMNDIKRVLAYSTISQLGYMMLGLATGGIAVGIFHLFNHAFFKALLFWAPAASATPWAPLTCARWAGCARRSPGHLPLSSSPRCPWPASGLCPASSARKRYWAAPWRVTPYSLPCCSSLPFLPLFTSSGWSSLPSPGTTAARATPTNRPPSWSSLWLSWRCWRWVPAGLTPQVASPLSWVTAKSTALWKAYWAS